MRKQRLIKEDFFIANMVKSLKIAGIFGIILLTLTLITFAVVFITIYSGGTVYDILPKAGVFNIFTIFHLIIPIVSIGFMYGFIALAKRFNNKMLLLTSRFIIIFIALSFFANLLFIIGAGDFFATPKIEVDSFLQQALFNIFSKIPFFVLALNLFGLRVFWPFLILFFIVGFFLQLVFAIGLIKLKNKGVPFANWSGWGEIIRMASENIRPIVIILEIIMFFKASKRFEQNSQTGY